MTYMVMENHLSYSIVLDEVGRFVKVANLNYQIGEVIDRVEIIEDKPRLSFIPRKTLTIAASLAAVLILMFNIVIKPFYIPYASIYMRINPEIQMEVSKRGRVIELIGKNQDGKELIKDFKFKKKDVDIVSKEISDLAFEKQYLKEGGRITILIDSPNDKWYEDRGKEFKREFTAYLKDKPAIEVVIKEYDVEDTKEENKEDSGENLSDYKESLEDSNHIEDVTKDKNIDKNDSLRDKNGKKGFIILPIDNSKNKNEEIDNDISIDREESLEIIAPKDRDDNRNIDRKPEETNNILDNYRDSYRDNSDYTDYTDYSNYDDTDYTDYSEYTDYDDSYYSDYTDNEDTDYTDYDDTDYTDYDDTDYTDYSD